MLDNQEHNQERDHIAAMTEEERLEWAFQEYESRSASKVDASSE